MGAGFWNPNSADIKLIRSQIAADSSGIEEVANNEKFIETFGEIQGDKLKKAPLGYSVDHPAIKWLRHKQFIVRKDFTDKEVMSADFVYRLNDTFQELDFF